jgi:hypothetical protein
MNVFVRFLVEPLYRLFYGQPIADSLPNWSEDAGTGEGDDASTTNGRRRGLVLVASGVGGFDLCSTTLRFVVAASDLNYAVSNLAWGHGLGRWWRDLSDVPNRDAKAALLASTIRRFQAHQPDDPVFLISKSGGAGVVVKALEQLEENAVERAILLAPALSPEYNLTTALRAVRTEIVAFWSPLDMVILGAGTRVFGTIDRVRGPSAGLVGFRPPAPPADDIPTTAWSSQNEPYAKLRQVRWSPRMATTGYLGGHLGPDSPVFLKNYVVPLLRAGPARES